MSPIQQMLLGVGAVATKTYVDDVFSTYVYTGTGSTRSINNAINLSGEGGLVWIKNRGDSKNHQLFDTERGAYKYLRSNGNNAETNNSSSLSAFNNNGFSVVSNLATNGSNNTYSSWTFRKAPGFFTCLTYVGNGSARTISHDLGCIPGLIMIKNLDSTENWRVYHKSIGAEKYVRLNQTNAAADSATQFNDTEPTSSVFSVGTDNAVNQNGDDFVAYLFAGGESTAATATSVEFQSSNTDKMTLPSTSGDLAFGTGDYTVECWVKFNSNNTHTIFQSTDAADNNTFYTSVNTNTGKFNVGTASAYITETNMTSELGQWYHLAACRSGGTLRMFQNGILLGSVSDSTNWSSTSGNAWIGANSYGGGLIPFDGNISNLRVVKGTALYTSSFRPPTEPLTNVTNTKLLCCQGAAATSATVIPSGASITNTGAAASTDSPFDDPAGFKFGESGSENVIKCGSYVGTATAGLEVNLGFEPQWLLLKNADDSHSWHMYDSMRGIVTEGDDPILLANDSGAEISGTNRVDLTSTGFKITYTGDGINGSGDTITYIAIRRPDGYVGKPPELGTDVFFQNYFADADDPSLRTSTFAGDFGLWKPTQITNEWGAGSRLTQGKRLETNTNNAETDNSNWQWDFNDGFNLYNNASVQQIGYMWKRHAGFDVQTFKGGAVLARPHNLGRVPEMIVIKSKNQDDWVVGHKGLNGGTNPWEYSLSLNSSNAEVDSNNAFDDTAPTATHWTNGAWGKAGGSSTPDYFIAILFASVEGISKVGSYTGNATVGHTITTGFQPRFIIIKKSSGTAYWIVLDTVRGWGSGNDNWLQLNANDAQDSYDWGYPTSTGFVLSTNITEANGNNETYIYYAHA